MGKPRLKEILSPEEYKNYRNVWASALMFVVLGAVFVLGGAAATMGDMPKKEDDPPRALLAAMTIVGVFGVIGGMATLVGSRRWAKLSRVFAYPYLLAFPIGTILGYTVLTGLDGYLKSRDQLRMAREQTA
jgi:hypothetical protein